MWEIFKPARQRVNSCESPACKVQRSEIITEILPNFPAVLILNFNWADPEALTARDLFRVLMSFSDPLSLHDFYHVNQQKHPEEKTLHYSISSFVCLSGAHYFTFIGIKNKYYISKWRLLNDTDVSKQFENWGEVVDFCISSKCVPTLLFADLSESAPSNH